MTTSSILALLYFTQEFIIESDASENGLGALLTQKGQLVAYFSKALTEHNLAKSTLASLFTW